MGQAEWDRPSAREKREERKGEERGGRKGHAEVQVKPSRTNPSSTTCSGVTGGHATQGGWAISRATAVSVT
jgi:hypothetical protein